MDVIHVEALVSNDFSLTPKTRSFLQKRIIRHIKQQYLICIPDDNIFIPVDLRKHVSLKISSISRSLSESFSNEKTKVWLNASDIRVHEVRVHVYQLNDEPSEEMTIKDSEGLKGLKHWTLPNSHFVGLWDSLIYENDSMIKTDLLNFLETTLFYSEKQVDMTLINWNKVVLLYGPPGTGKTSLAQALSQKMTIQLSNRFQYGYLVEISAHSLFSKWFSESGKLVKKVFQKINELVEEEESLVFILIDEVESLAVTRKKSIDGGEPVDSIRAVNAFITQLDQLKYHKNVMVLTTSNLEKSVDLAFVDRADIKQYIGYPSVEVRYRILRDCLLELVKKGIIVESSYKKKIAHEKYEIVTIDVEVLSFVEYKVLSAINEEPTLLLKRMLFLYKTAERCKDMSGRYLRKLPFLTHVYSFGKRTVDMLSFLKALYGTVTKIEKNSKKLFIQ